MISLRGKHLNLLIERGPALGPVLEVTVGNGEEAELRLFSRTDCCNRNVSRRHSRVSACLESGERLVRPFF